MEADEESEETEETHQNCSRHVLCMSVLPLYALCVWVDGCMGGWVDGCMGGWCRFMSDV